MGEGLILAAKIKIQETHCPCHLPLFLLSCSMCNPSPLLDHLLIGVNRQFNTLRLVLIVNLISQGYIGDPGGLGLGDLHVNAGV